MNIRPALLRFVDALTAPGYKLKLPAGFDFSHWETIPDWNAVTMPPGTAWLSTKATEGTNWVDDTFHRNWDAFGRIWPNALRSAYHFFSVGNLAGQVANFVGTVKSAGFDPKRDQVVLDEEYTGAMRGAALVSQVEYMLKGIEDGLGAKPIIYWSRNTASYLGVLPPWFNDYWHWVAWYPFGAYVDRNAWVPPTMVPIGLRLDHVMGWQYATNWVIQGVPYDGVDVNMISQAYLDSLAHTIPPPEPFKPYIKYADITRVVDASGTTQTERVV